MITAGYRFKTSYFFIRSALYFVLKSLVLPRMAGSSMGHACPV
jgi:hypothetical protein